MKEEQAARGRRRNPPRGASAKGHGAGTGTEPLSLHLLEKTSQNTPKSCALDSFCSACAHKPNQKATHVAEFCPVLDEPWGGRRWHQGPRPCAPRMLRARRDRSRHHRATHGTAPKSLRISHFSIPAPKSKGPRGGNRNGEIPGAQSQCGDRRNYYSEL